MEVILAKFFIFISEHKNVEFILGILLIGLGFVGLRKADRLFTYANSFLKNIKRREMDSYYEKPLFIGLIFTLIIFGILFILGYFGVGTIERY